MNKCKIPCKNCPMRVDYTNREWTQEQVDNILIADQQVFNMMACHKSKKREIPCAGWVISQIQNNFNNVGFRLSLITGQIKAEDYDTTFKVHKSIKEAFQNKVLEL